MLQRGSSTRQSVCSVGSEDEGGVEVQPHNYVIQATITMNSWPLSKSQWAFVQTLKEIEKSELKSNKILFFKKTFF